MFKGKLTIYFTRTFTIPAIFQALFIRFLKRIWCIPGISCCKPQITWSPFSCIPYVPAVYIPSNIGIHITLIESENERQKIEPVPIPLPRASRNFPDVKTRNENFFHNWTSEIIPFIRFGMQMDRT